MAKLRFIYNLILVLVAIFCTSASCSTDLFGYENSQTLDIHRLKRDDANNKLKGTTIKPTNIANVLVTSDSRRCVLPPTTPDKTYTTTCPIKENCGTKPGEQVTEFTVLSSKCNSGYAQYQDGGVSSNHTAINVCFNGVWSPKIPKCKRICNQLGSDELDFTCSLYLGGPIVPCDSTLLEGTAVVPRCKRLYHTSDRVNYRHVTCKADGTWDKEFFKCSSDCGKTRTSVVNLLVYGSKEKRGQAPWNVAVYSTESKEPAFICGGTLISSEFVVSSALCFYDIIKNKKLDPRLFSVMVAKETIDYKRMDSNNTKKYSVKTINIPDTALFNTVSYGSDLAVLQLSEPITLSEDVLPACVYWDDQDGFTPGENTFGKLSGFGATETGELASELRTINIPYMKFTDCVEQLDEGFKDLISFGKFCAGSKQGPGPRVGDSGGGLLFQDIKDGRLYLRGVVSARENGNSSISTFTDISLYMSWIKKIVPTVNHTAK